MAPEGIHEVHNAGVKLMALQNAPGSIIQHIITITTEQDPAPVRACVEDTTGDTEFGNLIIKLDRVTLNRHMLTSHQSKIFCNQL